MLFIVCQGCLKYGQMCNFPILFLWLYFYFAAFSMIEHELRQYNNVRRSLEGKTYVSYFMLVIRSKRHSLECSRA